MNEEERLLEVVEEALNRVCDHDLMGNPITDYSVLMMGAYGPAINRMVKAAATEIVNVRNKALEDAASVCESAPSKIISSEPETIEFAAEWCAARIRDRKQ